MAELKPCPFCGCKAILRESYVVYVECSKCGSRSTTYTRDICISDDGEVFANRNSTKEAIKAWNRRVADADNN